MSETQAPEVSRIYSPGEGTNIKRNADDHNSFTETLKSVKESIWGGKSRVEETTSSKVTDASGSVEETVKRQFATNSAPTMVQPTGFLSSLETRVSGKRYADRPEGIDQFGGEESERDVFVGDTSGVSATVRKYSEQPLGLDQFGGETMERERVEIKEWETKPSHAVNVQKFPQGADDVGSN